MIIDSYVIANKVRNPVEVQIEADANRIDRISRIKSIGDARLSLCS